MEDDAQRRSERVVAIELQKEEKSGRGVTGALSLLKTTDPAPPR